MEKDTLLEQLFRSATNKTLREEELLNIFGVTSLDDIPTDKLMQYYNGHYNLKGGLTYGS